MTNPFLWSDIGVVTVMAVLITPVMAYTTISLFGEAWQTLRGQRPANPYKLLLTLVALPVTLAFGWMGYTSANKSRLLRGECRYTVAQVYENTRIKGAKVSRYTYQVQGVRYEDQQEVDWLGGWRPLGSRWYVRFAVPDPNVHAHPGQAVPASVTQVPPAGWASLPPR